MFGINMQLQRESLGITQEELAEKLDVHQNTISRWENGSRSPKDEMKRKIASVLHTTVANLMKEGNDFTPLDLEKVSQTLPKLSAPTLEEIERWDKELHEKTFPEESSYVLITDEDYELLERMNLVLDPGGNLMFRIYNRFTKEAKTSGESSALDYFRWWLQMRYKTFPFNIIFLIEACFSLTKEAQKLDDKERNEIITLLYRTISRLKSDLSSQF